MHIWKRVGAVVGIAFGFVVRRRRLTVAVVIAVLLVGPLVLTGDVDLFALNALGVGVAALLFRRLVRFGRRRRHGDR